MACDVLVRAPWVCNGCRKNRYGCNRQNRFVYDAQVAQKASDVRRSESRRGIDMDPERAEVALSHIKDGLSRGLSPYEISVLYADVVGVHRSTIYRWVDAGYGGLTNIEIERKVGFRPRDRRRPREALGVKTPIQMLRFVYGDDDADAPLDALGIAEMGRDELMLKPGILDIERAKRGEPPLTRLK